MSKGLGTGLRGPIEEAGKRHGVQSYVMRCKGVGKDAGRCEVDWDDPEENDELMNESEQAVVFTCLRCKKFVLCTTWWRQDRQSD